MPRKANGTPPPQLPQWPADKVERRPIGELLPYARNARAHTEAQVAQIAASVKEWGWTIPVLVDEAGTIIAGHGRVLAAHLLRLADVPVMTAHGWSDAQKRAYRLVDNKLAQNSTWDPALLKVELADLQAAGADLLALTGFADFEITAALGLGITKPQDEWQDMPEFEQHKQIAFRSIIVHLQDDEAVAEFARRIGQPIGSKTKFLWFPEVPRDVNRGKRAYADENETAAADLHSIQR